MLTFEITPDSNVMEIHADSHGLAMLISHLQSLQKHEGHLHLMTPVWGGDELSEERQGKENRLMNHVKVMLWK